MADNLVGDIEGANNALGKMERLLLKLTETAGKFGKAMGGATQGMGNGGFGDRGLGVGSNNRLMGALGRFTTPPTGDVGATWGWANKRNMQLSTVQGAITAGTGIVAGGFAAMPDVGMTTARSTAFYNSNLINRLGPGGRSMIQNAVFSSMQGGISEPGGDAMATGILTGMGVSATIGKNGKATGQFGNLLTSTANAAKYLNIDNASAASALGGLTQGSTSQALMRNFGMYTTDPVTGKRYTPTEIFEQLNQRMTGGQKLSVKDLQTSMQGGALASNLQNSGLDVTQQQLAYQYMIDKAKGETMDLGNDKTMAQLQKEVGDNPMQSQYSANTSATGTMNAASDAYIEGMKKAAGVIDTFNKAMQNFLKSPAGQVMAQTNAGYSLASTDNVIGGGLTALGGIAGGLGQIGAAYFGGKILTSMLRKTGVLPGKGGGSGPKGGAPSKLPKGWKIASNGAVMKPKAGGKGFTFANKSEIAALEKGGLKGLSKGLAKAVPVVGTAINAFNIFNDVASGNWKGVAGDVGGILGGGAAAAGLTAATGGVGIVGSVAAYTGGSMAGSWAGEQLYDTFFGGKGDGGPSRIGTGGNSPTATAGGTSNFTLIHPVGKARIVCKYGTYDTLHPDGHWAVDWAATEGYGIMAAADGKVIEAGGNSRNTMGTKDRSYGLHIKIDHGNGYATLYAHMSGFDVSIGQTVKQGQQIGRVGNTGYSEAAHLHFELWQGSKRVDPSPFLGANYRDNSGVAGGGAAGVSSGNSNLRGTSGAGDAGLTGFSAGAGTTGNGLKIPKSYTGAAIGKSTAAGGGRTSASSGGAGKLLGKGSSSSSVGGSIGTTGSGDGPHSGGGGNNVTINVTVASASESEARRFAKLIKEYIDSDTLTSNMGRI